MGWESNHSDAGRIADSLMVGSQSHQRQSVSLRKDGGWGGIRTHETLARLPVFKTGAFNHSATHPSAHQGSFLTVKAQTRGK